MTPDSKIYALAAALLKSTGDTSDVLTLRLAERLLEAFEDFVADLENEDNEREDHNDTA